LLHGDAIPPNPTRGRNRGAPHPRCPVMTTAAGVAAGDNRDSSIRRNKLMTIAIMNGGKYGHKD